MDKSFILISTDTNGKRVKRPSMSVLSESLHRAEADTQLSNKRVKERKASALTSELTNVHENVHAPRHPAEGQDHRNVELDQMKAHFILKWR